GIGNRNRAADLFPVSRARRRSRRPPAKESSGLRFLARTLPRPYAGSPGHVSPPIDLGGGFSVHWGRTQSLAALSAQAPVRKHGTSGNDGGIAGLCARGLRHFFSSPFVEAARPGCRETLSTR